MFDYKPPIQMIATDLEIKIENGVYSAVQKYGVEVDKDELIKALKYDRNQYDRGYWRGREEAIKEFAETLKQKKYRLFKYDEGGWGSPVFVVNVDDIDKLIKEIAGIVKCKDCKYFSSHPDHCYRLASDDVDEDFWCKYGEKT